MDFSMKITQFILMFDCKMNKNSKELLDERNI